jgi:hypothetical protein
MSRRADEADRPSPGDAPGLEAFNALLRRTLALPPKPHSEMKLGKPRGRKAVVKVVEPPNSTRRGQDRT